ncbi:MAG: hypothetical protein HOO67_03240 [Candidatus Peribacteraceae bacterium]|nr:hypothetical protein [Candidatus Peribacteraceae bacterium]
MNLTLSWDLFIVVFFALVITYSFIIGKKEAIKIILSSYVAIVAVAGIGNFAQRLFGFTETQSMLGVVGIPLDTTMTSILNLTLFITIIVFLAVKAGFHVQYSKEGSMAVNMGMTAAAGFATAGLLLATLLTFISGANLFDMQVTATPGLAAILENSQLMSLMISNLDVWFTLPAVVLIAAGIMSNH